MISVIEQAWFMVLITALADRDFEAVETAARMLAAESGMSDYAERVLSHRFR
ncbi:MAG TPA: hypothetical protein VKR55_21105 [Bradyrhizobium sp.]|uniref:hypothetical protein n=1 Tax=Bradyrhizobium sp. TaxID=376 RepID=UPI002BD7B960|nr:hypothetical protein [Bradyrhizobium sp.]HLZ04631.1 hypothetical protein [Bradyrhizobium sp.]